MRKGRFSVVQHSTNDSSDEEDEVIHHNNPNDHVIRKDTIEITKEKVSV